MDGLDMSVVYEFTMAGAKQDLSLKQIQEIIAVELAIQSGELELPWSQEEIEQQAQGYGPELIDTQKLIASQPQFIKIASRWAYAKSSDLFYMLHSA